MKQTLDPNIKILKTHQYKFQFAIFLKYFYRFYTSFPHILIVFLSVKKLENFDGGQRYHRIPRGDADRLLPQVLLAAGCWALFADPILGYLRKGNFEVGCMKSCFRGIYRREKGGRVGRGEKAGQLGDIIYLI